MRRLHRASVGCRRGAGCNHSVSLHGRERRVDQKLHLGLLLPNHRTAIQHPEVVKKLVLVSTPFKRDGWYPEILAGMGQMGPQIAEPMKQTPMYQHYASIAPKPEDWPVLLTKLGELLRQDYDWSNEVAAIKAPTLIVVGDADSVRTAHAVAFFELLGGGKVDAGWDGSGMSNARLAILPATTHYNIYSSPQLSAVVAPFLDAPMPGTR